MSLLNPGVLAPEFTLLNQDAQQLCLSDLRGRQVLIWFYSRAFGSN